MKLKEREIDRPGEDIQIFDVLIGDKLSGMTFQAVIAGIIASESLWVAQIRCFPLR